MPDLFNTNNAALPPQNRPLTGPANAPAQPMPQQPMPQQPYAAAPPAAMAPDQSTVQPGQARDPQIVAAISIYAMQLNSDNPVEVSAALATMESYGPAYRAEVLQAISQHLRPGEKPMRSLVLMDALVRNGGPEVADRLLPLMQDADPMVRAEASKAFGRLRPTPAPTAGGPVNAGVPGVPGMPAAQPGMPTQPTVPGQAPPHLQHLVDRFKDYFQLGDAAMEFARLSTADQIAVANAFIAAPRDDNHFEKSYDLISSVLAKKVQEPGVLDTMRNLLNKEGVRTFIGAKAKMRAATALLHFGQPTDAPAIAKILVQHSFLTLDGRKLLIDQIAQKPAFLNHPAILPALVAQMHTETWEWTLAAGNALAKIPNRQARDAIGESAMFKQDSAGPTKQLWMLEFLAAHPGPYSPLTIQYLQRMARSSDKRLKKKAEELINKKG